MNPDKRIIAVTARVVSVAGIATARTDDEQVLRIEGARLEDKIAVTGESLINSRVSHDFTVFAGSDTNVRRLVTGLRNGSPVTLTARSGTNQQPSAVTILPPVRRMSTGDIYISLALARLWLARLGITQPTPVQIKAVLVGGTVLAGYGHSVRTVTLPGVLLQRSQGMGWSKVARSQGLTLESVVRGVKNTRHDLWAAYLQRLVASYAMAAASAHGGKDPGDDITTTGVDPAPAMATPSLELPQVQDQSVPLRHS